MDKFRGMKDDDLWSVDRVFDNQTSKIKLDLIGMLTEDQQKMLSGVGKFLYGGRGTGRSYVAAMAAIIVALENPGKTVMCFDHFPQGGNYLIMCIKNILSLIEIVLTEKLSPMSDVQVTYLLGEFFWINEHIKPPTIKFMGWDVINRMENVNDCIRY